MDVVETWTIVDGALWHWILIPVLSTDVTVADAFAQARGTLATEWVSIVEDRRADRSRVTAVWMTRAQAIPEELCVKEQAT